YMSAGKPVVATDLPELGPYRALFYPASTAEEFVHQLEAALAERDPARVEARKAMARQNTWDARARALDEHIRQLYSRAAIVIVSYHNLDYLRLCLESIWARTEYPNYEVIVVDNASPAEVREYLQQCQSVQPRLRVILNPENLGFARANNLGLQEARARACEYVALLNNDTVVTRGWLSGLVRHLQHDPALGMVGPATNWASNEARVAVDYQTLDGLEPFAEQYTEARPGMAQDVRTLDLFCAALRVSVVDEVGPLDEGFGLGMFEDDDYALRLRRAGYRLACVRDVFIHHWGWASFGRLDQAEYDRLFEANRRRFETKWGERWERPPLNLGLREKPESPFQVNHERR
ncbi:MAG: glycosyltransferase, partial [Anaerolineales bacterium]